MFNFIGHVRNGTWLWRVSERESVYHRGTVWLWRRRCCCSWAIYLRHFSERRGSWSRKLVSIAPHLLIAMSGVRRAIYRYKCVWYGSAGRSTKPTNQDSTKQNAILTGNVNHCVQSCDLCATLTHSISHCKVVRPLLSLSRPGSKKATQTHATHSHRGNETAENNMNWIG